MGECAPAPFTSSYDFWLRYPRFWKEFLSVVWKLSQVPLFKILYSSDKWVYTPNKSRDVFFSDILAMESSLNTFDFRIEYVIW